MRSSFLSKTHSVLAILYKNWKRELLISYKIMGNKK